MDEFVELLSFPLTVSFVFLVLSVLEKKSNVVQVVSSINGFSSQASSSEHGAGAQPRYSEPPQQIELKLNVTDSQLVLVEDPSVWDTNAVILRVRHRRYFNYNVA